MQSEIKTHTYPNGDIQRVQIVRWDNWADLDFLSPTPCPDRTLACFSHIYRNFLVPAAPWLFGNLVMFRLPEDGKADFPFQTGKYGRVSDPLTAAAAALQSGLRIVRGEPRFQNEETARFFRQLQDRGCVEIVRGRLPVTTIIPLGPLPGCLTETAPEAVLKVNASFFIMDRFDCATVYDHVGTPIGLNVRDGIVSHPPLYGREALLVDRDGRVSIRNLDIRDLRVEINGTVYTHGENARIYTRPGKFRSPVGSGTSLVIIGNQVAAVAKGSVPIPASGFVLCPRLPCQVKPGDRVTYRGLENTAFGIQVGNSILRDGIPTDRFHSRFYNIRRLEPVPYPPSLYPMDFDHARAARIALGADLSGKPMLLWAEGAAKFGHIPGSGSCGASLSEMAVLCADAGMVNAVNLDGGGSAQILLHGQRSLKISDRSPQDFSETERPVPLGLVVR